MRITKSKIAVAAASAAVVALGSTAAYAFFTTGGSGAGSATVGTNKALTAVINVGGGALVPDGSAHQLSYVITNPATFAQHASTASVAFGTITANAAHGGGTLTATHCGLSIVAPVPPAAGYTFPAGDTTVNAQPGTGALVMSETGSDQSDCEGATVNLVGTIS